MPDKLLVAHASRYGSTAGVPQAIGQTLREEGAEVYGCLVQDVSDMSAYRAVIVGSAVHVGKWLSA